MVTRSKDQKKKEQKQYESHSEAARKRQARISESGREIGPLPVVENPKRRKAALASLRLFLKTYFPKAFRLGFSPDHERALQRIEEAITEGGLFALAMPRGRGKTTILIRAVLWAILRGDHRYVMLVGANEGKADRMLKAIRTELSRNALLLADFPEVCYPIWCLKNNPVKARQQTLDGQFTAIDWAGGDQLVLPTVPGSIASGAIIECVGILGAARGAQYTTDQGDVLRPTLILFDDPQTRESASSFEQSETRHQIIVGDLLGLAGPDDRLSMLGAVTAIKQGDLACRLLDRELSPEWRGELFSMLHSFPTNMELWERWYEIRRSELVAHAGFVESRDFYREHWEAMHAGAKIDWAEAINHKAGDLDALETAMALFFFNEESFFAERQNKPRNLLDSEDAFWTAEQIAAKVSGWPRRKAPLEVEKVTAFVDVHQRALFWMVCGWSMSFEGYILDYGAWPKQRASHFTLRNCRSTLLDTYKGAGKEGAVHQGLQSLFNHLFVEMKLEREDGEQLSVNRCLVDCRWNKSVVLKAIREHAKRSLITPSTGTGYTHMMTPISGFRPRAGELIGEEWNMPPLAARRALRELRYDTNYWKTFWARRLATAIGDKGCVSICGKPGDRHDLLSRHLSAEYRTTQTGKRTADIWEMRVGEVDNHWLDCGVGNAVAASTLGCKLVGSSIKKKLIPLAIDEGEVDHRVTYID